jgi:hypothetical protein
VLSADSKVGDAKNTDPIVLASSRETPSASTETSSPSLVAFRNSITLAR